MIIIILGILLGLTSVIIIVRAFYNVDLTIMMLSVGAGLLIASGFMTYFGYLKHIEYPAFIEMTGKTNITFRQYFLMGEKIRVLEKSKD